MQFSEPSIDKFPPGPDITNSVSSANGHMVTNNEGQYLRKKIVVVGLGMVALSFMWAPLAASSIMRILTELDLGWSTDFMLILQKRKNDQTRRREAAVRHHSHWGGTARRI
jgi:hypothetical protein